MREIFRCGKARASAALYRQLWNFRDPLFYRMLTRRFKRSLCACLQNTSVYYWGKIYPNISCIYVFVSLRYNELKSPMQREKLPNRIFSKLLEIIIPYFANMKQLLVKHHRFSRVLVSRRGFARTSTCLGRRMTYLPRVAHISNIAPIS